MQTFEIANTKLLLTRVNGRCHAVSATCPHAGAPLGEGVLRDGVVTCPWHKAAFRVDTGERLEPPAVDDLTPYPVTVSNSRVSVTIPDQVDDDLAQITVTDPRCMAIIGAGAAGAIAAQTLRESGFAGRVVLIGTEERLPYDRTIQSKYALSGKQGKEKSPLQNEDFYTKQAIERMTRTVVSVEPAARRIRFQDGGELAYDAALLATGGAPRALDLPGQDLKNVHLLRTPDDAAAIVRSAETAKHAVVIGVGFIGMEAAASLRERGLEVAVVAPQSAPLEKQLGAEVGTIFRRVHEREGIAFHLGQEVAALEGDGRVAGVRLKNGNLLPADLVVAGLGVTPATEVLKGASRREDGGVAVDAQLRVAEGLYAAGDIAAFPLYGSGERIRVEHWRVAEQHGRVAALNMMGRSTSYDAVPVFWTINFMKRLDYVGHATDWDEIVIDGDTEKPEFIAFYAKAGRVQAVAGWSRDQQIALAISLMEERHDWAVGELREKLS